MGNIDYSKYIWGGVREPKLKVGTGLSVVTLTLPGAPPHIRPPMTMTAIDTGREVTFIPDQFAREVVFVAETMAGSMAEMERREKEMGVAYVTPPVKTPVRTTHEIEAPEVEEPEPVEPGEPDEGTDSVEKVPATPEKQLLGAILGPEAAAKMPSLSKQPLRVVQPPAPTPAPAPKPVKTCEECGGPAKGRGFKHKEGCSKVKPAVKPAPRGRQVRLVELPKEED